jgi:chaperone modulatory protein CbpM
MIGFKAVIERVSGIDEVELRRWIDENWVRPAAAGESWIFEEVDVARIRLIYELRHELAIEEESLPVVLHLLDQVYELRRHLRAVRDALEEQPQSVRDAVRARLAGSLGEDDEP